MDIKITLTEPQMYLRKAGVKSKAKIRETAKDQMDYIEMTYWNTGRSVDFAINVKPQRVHPGCWVYFILCDMVMARATVTSFRRQEQDDDSYNIKSKPGKKWVVTVGPPTEVAKHPMPCKGFLGFRYARPGENLHRAFQRRKPGEPPQPTYRTERLST